ncbi:30S ribosomal protein S1, partial [Streptomyces rhizosphaerihabitans]|nr:30S ribosomal protein S1 [Streptomyces rhizosphaerihabitans]
SEFDPTLYGMTASYDDQGNYIYPEGFDPDAGEWLPGFESQREVWETQYAEAQQRFERHKAQVIKSRKADAATELDEADVAASDEDDGPTTPGVTGGPYDYQIFDNSGALATDEALAALRERPAGGQN